MRERVGGDSGRRANVDAASDAIAPIEIDGHSRRIARSLGDVNLDDLPSEVENAGGSAIWWGYQYARALRGAKLEKRNVKIVMATRAREIRERCLLPSYVGPKLTEAGLGELLTLDTVVQEAETRHIEAEFVADTLRAVHGAVEEKQRTLRNLTGALQREMSAASAGKYLRDTMRTRVDEMRGDSPRS